MNIIRHKGTEAQRHKVKFVVAGFSLRSSFVRRLKPATTMCLCAFVPLCLSSRVWAAGETAVDSLNLGVGARPLAMGNAYTAVSDDIYAIYWNPAGLASLQRIEAGFMHNSLGKDANQEFAAVSFNRKRKNLDLYESWALSAMFVGVGQIQGYAQTGVKTRELSNQNLNFSLAYARNINRYFSYGLAVKGIREKLAEYKAQAVAFDAGIMYNFVDSRLKFGLNVTNLSPGIKFIREKEKLPANLSVGVSWQPYILGKSLLLAADFVRRVSESPDYNFGAEYKAFEPLIFRAGYTSRDDLSNGLRLGFGLNVKNSCFDYAFEPRGDFANSHRFSLTVRWGHQHDQAWTLKNIESHYEGAGRAYYQGKFFEARAELENVLKVAPGHVQAQELMARVELKMENAQNEQQIEKLLREAQKYYQTGDMVNAQIAYEQALSLVPEHQGALQGIERIKKRFSEIVQAILTSAVKEFNRENISSAREGFQKALSLDPENKEAENYLSLIEDRERKLQEIRQSLEIQKLLVQARGYARESKWKKALKETNAILTLKPSHPEAMSLKEKALKELQAKELDGLVQTGDSYMKDKNCPEAVANFEEALKIAPAAEDIKSKLTEARDCLRKQVEKLLAEAASLYAANKFAESAKLLSDILRLDPDQEEARRYLQKVTSMLKK